MLMSLRNVGQTFEEWKQTNTLQKVDDELNVNSDDGLDCNWKNQIKGDHLDEWESFTVENDNSIPPLKPSASFPISGHVLSDPYFLHRWFEHNAAQKRVEEEREVARRARNERRRAATFRKLEKLQGKQVRRPPQHVSRELRVIHDDSSESSISLGHDEEFDDVAFIHDPNESDDDDSLSELTDGSQSTDDFLGKGKLVLQAHSKHRRKFPPVGYRMTRLISYISPLLLIKCFLLKLRMLLSSSRLVLISNVVLALKLGLSLERLSSTAVMQMKILKEQNLDHLEIVGQEERRLHVVRVGGVTGNGEESGHRVRYGVWTNSLLITQRIKD
ncbi:hypothetical protein BLNAU_23189 [Blattamonas nauphoetae]|uniref:Uncharacterized protein n=1 Tax=Blattamonas nauphoetae TaxID=2049346 RepID=A0ABQ9WQW9_9EUKA|nr:hypothetical protein BLNAU_23189 [Blattamonas nauphoetae]